MRLRLTVIRALLCAVFLLAATSQAAGARIFGTNPLNISTAPDGSAANGHSGQPSVAGDNRKITIVSFYSDASNLTGGDSNGTRDIFVWHRPRGATGRKLNRLGVGSLERASIGPYGQANGPSDNPSTDGSMNNRAHCVAFQSRATNLSPADATPDLDIYVRDVKRNKTYLVSKRSPGDASNPSISGSCKKVVYEANGDIYNATYKGTHNRSLGPGTTPDYSLDGQSMTWVKDGRVVFRHPGHNRTLGPGTNPVVSDRSGPAGWAVGYNSGGAVMLGIIRNSGKTHDSVAIHSGIIGGVTAYAAQRGIMVYTTGNSVFYLNRHTGNTDDLAHAYSSISDTSASARSNLVSFAASGGESFIDPPGRSTQGVYVKYLPR
jgi:hypothetical protein